MRVVRQRDAWMLGHIDGFNYKLFRLKGNQWVDYATFNAASDTVALEKTKDLVYAEDRKKE